NCSPFFSFLPACPAILAPQCPQCKRPLNIYRAFPLNLDFLFNRISCANLYVLSSIIGLCLPLCFFLSNLTYPLYRVPISVFDTVDKSLITPGNLVCISSYITAYPFPFTYSP